METIQQHWVPAGRLFFHSIRKKKSQWIWNINGQLGIETITEGLWMHEKGGYSWISWCKRREKYSRFITKKLQQLGLGCFEEQLGQMANSEGRKERDDLYSAVDIAFTSGEYVWKVTRLQWQVPPLCLTVVIFLLFDTANQCLYFILIHTYRTYMCIWTQHCIYRHICTYTCMYICT